MNESRYTPRLGPNGHFAFSPAPDGPLLAADLAGRLFSAFDRGAGHGLLHLGAREVGTALPPVLSYWREFSARYLTALCTRPDTENGWQPVPPPGEGALATLSLSAPEMPGAEYVSPGALVSLWKEIDRAFSEELAESKLPLPEFLRGLGSIWNVVGRVHFHLAENRKDEVAPFAFLATYTGRLSSAGRAQHLPLGQALTEYAGAEQKDRLLSLLLPVQKAAESCPWLRRMVNEGEIFHPLRWSPADAFRFLRDVPALERAGVVVRMPAAWPARRPSRPRVTGTLATGGAGVLGRQALLDFEVSLTLDGETLTEEEIRSLLAGTSGLAMIRGRWVEVDPERLSRALARFEEARRIARERGLSFAEATRFLSGTAISGEDAELAADREWSEVVAGPGLGETLRGLTSREGLERVAPGKGLTGTLRPYQEVGLRWLHLITGLGLGACLADDMGLGKTIQVLALLVVLRKETRGDRRPSLLVAPASLLANWEAEIRKFAPGLRALLAHPSAMPAGKLKGLTAEDLDEFDLVITTYGSLIRIPWLGGTSFDLAILDEAQAIKNPGAKQTRAAKKLAARARIVLTGTPVENRLSDLWSLFDFANPGLLGSAREFKMYVKSLADRPGNPYAPIRDLIRPYILRRLKTDPAVISDLPEKTEVKAYCPLSRRQAALYGQAVTDLEATLDEADGMARRGAVLAALMRFKQICNHPSQWLGDGAYTEEDSGKWGRLREIAEVVAAKQEKVLVFTQFREITGPLDAFLGGLFGRPGVVLTGETPVKKRKGLVASFMEDDKVPYFVLSLKAGGSGLNLTAASHVVHFDRWWNPAVENQATDRAFRIGQKRNVLVHKFVCRGTVEERIDELIESKVALSKQLLQGGSELNLTELGNEEILDLVRLDLNSATEV